MDDVDVDGGGHGAHSIHSGSITPLQLDPLESGAIEHLALLDLTPEMED